MLVGITDTFDKLMTIDDNEPNSYDCFDFIDETYECFRVYHDKFAELNKVTLTRRVVFVRVSRILMMINRVVFIHGVVECVLDGDGIEDSGVIGQGRTPV